MKNIAKFDTCAMYECIKCTNSYVAYQSHSFTLTNCTNKLEIKCLFAQTVMWPEDYIYQLKFEACVI